MAKKTNKEKKVIGGNTITQISTLSSWNDKGSIIQLHDDKGKIYRMNVSEFLKVVNDVEFEVERKRTHDWLTLQTIV